MKRLVYIKHNGSLSFLQRSSLYFFFSEPLIIYGMNNYIEETKKSSFKTHRGVCSGSDLISSFLCFISCYQCASGCGLHAAKSHAGVTADMRNFFISTISFWPVVFTRQDIFSIVAFATSSTSQAAFSTPWILVTIACCHRVAAQHCVLEIMTDICSVTVQAKHLRY